MEQKQKLNGNSTNQMMATKPFHVKGDHIYNYTVSAEAKNVSSYSASRHLELPAMFLKIPLGMEVMQATDASCLSALVRKYMQDWI